MATLVLLRHGQSTWNAEERFTGWTDVPLTERGIEEARNGGKALAAHELEPDLVHTSLQVRAIRTAELGLEELGRQWLPVRRHWRLNERHYGALEGFTHAEIAERHGAEAVRIWRRSYDVRPPALEPDDPRHPSHDARYADLAPDVVPSTECLADVLSRLLPYWHDAIVPDLRSGAIVLVVAHGNSLRAMVKHLEGISDTDIPGLEIPTGVPIRYELDRRLTVTDRNEVR